MTSRMESKTEWWSGDLPFISGVAAQIDVASQVHGDVRTFEQQCKALNSLWTRYSHRPDASQPDSAAADDKKLSAMIRGSLCSDDLAKWCDSEPVRSLSELRPLVLNQQHLEQSQYDPQALDLSLREQAEQQHRQFCSKFEKYCDKRTANGTASTREVIDSLSRLLYMVRSNLMHGGKTVHGPDLKKKERDRAVCSPCVGIPQKSLFHVDVPKQFSLVELRVASSVRG